MKEKKEWKRKEKGEGQIVYNTLSS